MDVWYIHVVCQYVLVLCAEYRGWSDPHILVLCAEYIGYSRYVGWAHVCAEYTGYSDTHILVLCGEYIGYSDTLHTSSRYKG